MRRRQFIKGLAATVGTLPLLQSAPSFAKYSQRRAIVLGMDGMEPSLLKKFVDEGIMPTFKRFMEQGGYSGALGTTLPALSPVAWSSFATGLNPGKHGIYDFIHRGLTPFGPELATSTLKRGGRSLDFLGLSIPLEGDHHVSNRGGLPLWHYLDNANVPSTFYRLPGTFPVDAAKARILSGMGTPDILGGYGTATLVIENGFEALQGKPGVRVVKIRPKNFRYSFSIDGPQLEGGDKPPAEVPVEVFKDPNSPNLFLKIQSHELVLKNAEWSPWIPLQFSSGSHFGASVSGIVKIYVKQAHPELQLYISPISVDPSAPAVPISNPAGYSRELVSVSGPFNTMGLPANTKSLAQGVLNDEEYLADAKSILQENIEHFEHEIANFSEGLLYFYFSSLDQNCHMLWRCMDPAHPQYNPNASEEVKNGVRYFYQKMDQILARTLEAVSPDTLVMVVSDHGFAPFTREFQMNSWLRDNGLLRINAGVPEYDFGRSVNWGETQVYGMGFAGLFVNLKGREPFGTVEPKDKDQLIARMCAELSVLKDPLNGQTFARAVPASVAYSGPFLSRAPDIIVTCTRGYRIADESVLGRCGEGIVAPRMDLWSADHCMFPELVPGVLVMNRPSTNNSPALWDLAPSLLSYFGISYGEGDFDGRTLLKDA